MRTLSSSLAALLGASFSAGAFAQAAGEWHFEVTPYLWGAGMQGDVQAPNLPRTNVDMSFVDVLHNLDFGLMGALEARKGRWGLLFDGIYMKVSDSASTTQGPLSVGADATIKQQVLAGAITYRVSAGPTLVDVLGGARYSKIKVKAIIDGSLFGLGGRVERTGDKSWTDAYVGIRVQAPLNERWTMAGYADVGAGGSDSAWQAAIGAQYAYSKDIALKFGYRYYSVDYDKKGFLYDMDSAGLYFGAGFRF